MTNEQRAAFEARTFPSLNMRLGADSCYHYYVTQDAYMNFCDGWQAAIAYMESRMESDEMVEAVANAIYGEESVYPLDNCLAHVQKYYKQQAKAAIQAMKGSL